MAKKKSVKRTSFLVYLDYAKHFNKLKDEELGFIFRYMLNYANNLESPDLYELPQIPEKLEIVMSIILDQMVRDRENYIDVCNKNAENIKKRWEQSNTNEYDRIQMNTNYTNKDIDKDIDTDTGIDIDTDTKKEIFVSVIDSYTQNEELKEALHNYVEMRKSMKGFTVNALKLNLNELDKLAVNDPMKIEIVNQSISRSWKGLFPVEKKKVKSIDEMYRSDDQEMPF